ncbi:2-oxo-4-hydroxy-4-carboxy-5-ureidoimidazoline decarboxylase [Streptomyces sp. TRM64462]|uniref:2-oxo-4-hydroxy-4-carboxy-5-ureidoimidazoline decarboxylase n=1 Tax=Streptomyces sp. TRM64462 TaxID=2741726 RepID=UPI001C2F8F88
MSSESAAGSPTTFSAAPAIPATVPRPRDTADALACLNAAPAEAAETSLLACCGSRRWAQRLAAHRPYPTLDALLAAADEAGYDLSGADLDEALADEAAPALPPGTPPAAHTALRAAHDVYESRFGHAFVVCLAGHHPEEYLDRILGGIRARLGNEPEEERAVAADELRRLARARLARLVGTMNDSGGFSSPSVAV